MCVLVGSHGKLTAYPPQRDSLPRYDQHRHPDWSRLQPLRHVLRQHPADVRRASSGPHRSPASWETCPERHVPAQSKFRGSSATLMGSADCRSLAVGLENCRFEGPVRLQLAIPKRLGKVDGDGAFAISLPLPSTSQTVRPTVCARPEGRHLGWSGHRCDCCNPLPRRLGREGGDDACHLLPSVWKTVRSLGNKMLAAQYLTPRAVCSCSRVSPQSLRGRASVNSLFLCRFPASASPVTDTALPLLVLPGGVQWPQVLACLLL